MAAPGNAMLTPGATREQQLQKIGAIAAPPIFCRNRFGEGRFRISCRLTGGRSGCFASPGSTWRRANSWYSTNESGIGFGRRGWPRAARCRGHGRWSQWAGATLAVFADAESLAAFGDRIEVAAVASSRPARPCGAMSPGMAKAGPDRVVDRAALHPDRHPGDRVSSHRREWHRQFSALTSPRISRTVSRILSARSTPADVMDGSMSRSTASCVKEGAHEASSSSLPAVSGPPTNAPIDDPAMPTISWPRSRNSFITPMCA